jgi:hypothetical protein
LQQLDESVPKEATKLPCGQYGFRCVDEKTFHLCDAEDEDDVINREKDVHECEETTLCDEDNPAFCSVADELTFISNQCSNSHNTKRKLRHVDGSGTLTLEKFDKAKDEVLYGVQDRAGDYINDDEFDGTVLPSTTEIDDYDTFTTQPEYDCEMFGFYPDYKDKTSFFYCDVRDNGVGFKLHHMKCAKNRIFDTFRRECVLIGTTRNIRNKSTEDAEHLLLDNISKKNFSCERKRMGKYADKDNCQVYHICLTRYLFTPFEHLTAICGSGKAFDSVKYMCTKSAMTRCHKLKAIPSSDVLCSTPKRFADAKSCKVYYLCLANQVVQLQCPETYQFNFNLLLCMPQHLVKCQIPK